MTTAVAGVRGHADERGDLPPVEPSEFRKIGQQRRRKHAADARHTPQEVLLCPPDRARFDGLGHLALDPTEFLLQPPDVLRQALPDGGVGQE